MQSNFNTKLKPQKGLLTLFIYFALVLITMLVYWQVRNFDFVNYDDNAYVYQNQHVLNGLSYGGVIQAFTTRHAFNWHPVTWLSLMLDYQLFGPKAGGFHLVNLFLHLANTLLLFAVFRKMTGSLWPSAFVAAAFAIHPMHVESVVWITERKDVLSTFFFLLTLVTYAGYVKCPSVFRYITTIVLFALGLMAKPMLVTLPFVLLLLDYWPLSRFEVPQSAKISSRRLRKSTSALARYSTPYRLIIEKIPFFALAVVSSVITCIVQATTDVHVTSMEKRFYNAFLSYILYIGKLFWPKNLAVLYPFEATGSIKFWQFALSAVLLACVTILVIRFSRSRKYLPVGWFWFVGTLIPVIGLVQVGLQAYADRYTYIPYIGLFMMIAWGVPELLSRQLYRREFLGISAVIVLTALGICSHRQVSLWENSITLFSHALKVTQNNYPSHNNLGIAYGGLGRAYGRLGRYHEAIEAFKQAIKIMPDGADLHYNLGVAYNSLGRYEEAVEAFKQAIKIKPDDAEAQINLGAAYNSLGRYEEAIEAFKQAIKIKPDYADAQINLGTAYNSFGRYEGAIEAFRQAIKIKPDDAEVHYDLGVAYLKVGNKTSALQEYNILKTMNTETADKLLSIINK